MRLWKRFKRWIKNVISSNRGGSVTPTSDPVTLPPVDSDEVPPIPTPRLDVTDDGNTRDPDWSFIASQAQLDTGGLASTTAWYAARALRNRERYEVVGNQLNIPWWFIAALHMRESGMSFAGALHNGDEILGTGRKTYRVPAGRGPFDTWEESAVDALKMKNFHKKTGWSLGAACAYAERFNGLGYRSRGEYSPYVAAGTTFHDETGKFYADGKFSSRAKEKQSGVLALWLKLGVRND